jgi:SAM-dependent methyltransferase
VQQLQAADQRVNGMGSNSERRHAEATGDAPGAETAVRRMYEFAPYPDLGAALKDPRPVFDPIAADLGQRPNLRYLEAGCGTGHFLVGVAKAHPDWHCFGLDLSSASLEIAGKLATQHGAKITLARGSYLEPLPFDSEPFDVISAIGTIHHAEDPVAALKNLRSHLADDGWFAMHLYGRRLDAEKFDIKEMLSIFEPDLFAHERRFKLYRELVAHRRASGRLRRLFDTSPLDVIRMSRRWITDLRRRARATSWSPPWHNDYRALSAPWIDHFCHPCERAYEVADIRRLIEGAGFKVEHMLGQGREEPERLPPAWRQPFERLEPWDRWRLMELVSPARSFVLLMRKA